MDAAAVRSLPGSPLVVKYAPQLEILSKANLTITHVELNTTLDSLSYGVPLVAIPITFEQPENSARICWTQTGKAKSLSQLSVPKLRAAIQRVLTKPIYLQNAQRFQQEIQQAGGIERAASLIEQAASQ